MCARLDQWPHRSAEPQDESDRRRFLFLTKGEACVIHLFSKGSGTSLVRAGVSFLLTIVANVEEKTCPRVQVTQTAGTAVGTTFHCEHASK